MDLWEFEARLAYIASSRPAKATYLNPFLKINKKEEKEKLGELERWFSS